MQNERLFADFCAAHGLTGAEIVADGALHRADDPNGKRGNKLYWYVMHTDGLPAGVLGHWRDGWVRTWTAKTPATDSERNALNERVIEAQRKRRLMRDLAQQDAAVKAVSVWRNAVPADGHPYLMRKAMPAFNLRQLDGVLLVPLFSPDDGRLVNLQRIWADGTKRFMPGGRVTGCYWPVGELKLRLFVCEGAATAATLHHMTGDAVAASMNAGNLIHVARALQRKHPEAEIVIGADDDRLTPGNPGQTAARRAAAELGIEVASPDWPPDAPDDLTDFNDLLAWRVRHEAGCI